MSVGQDSSKAATSALDVGSIIAQAITAAMSSQGAPKAKAKEQKYTETHYFKIPHKFKLDDNGYAVGPCGNPGCTFNASGKFTETEMWVCSGKDMPANLEEKIKNPMDKIVQWYPPQTIAHTIAARKKINQSA